MVGCSLFVACVHGEAPYTFRITDRRLFWICHKVSSVWYRWGCVVRNNIWSVYVSDVAPSFLKELLKKI